MPASANAEAAESERSTRGLAFVQARCSGCHAVTPGRSSPNPEAPSFETVVSTPGLTAATLKPWLRDSHNFPAMMNFAIAPDQIDDLAAYMITLQHHDYKPPIQ
jgi:mono/diheme cytochrome c family protein